MTANVSLEELSERGDRISAERGCFAGRTVARLNRFSPLPETILIRTIAARSRAMFRVAKYLCDRPIRPLKNRRINRSARISTRVDVCFGRDRPPASIYAETSFETRGGGIVIDDDMCVDPKTAPLWSSPSFSSDPQFCVPASRKINPLHSRPFSLGRTNDFAKFR